MKMNGKSSNFSHTVRWMRHSLLLVKNNTVFHTKRVEFVSFEDF